MTTDLIAIKKRTPMFKASLTNKAKLAYLILAIVLVIAIITTGTIIILKSANNTKKVTETTITLKVQADTTKAQALAAIKNKDTTKARTLLKEANQHTKT